MKFLLKTALAGVFTFAAGGALAADCEVNVDSTDQMRFDTDAISIPASCESFTVNLTHSGSIAANIMGHNWVLTKTAELQALAQEGMSAGIENNYLPPDDARVIAATKIIGGGESTSVTFDVAALNPEEDYSFFCSFPGHYALMKGTVTID
ncbi:azurin [Gilvimarinus sp. SDUM040013]|uniref:Azurin n=1 Tax=Gilvimarinus gilvus TaxID=3058038 RepID=A0ABU4RW76_9GAMM|nr:azurin [Gilvimarinus sp. SDUM040013]MDO3386534.1 azurin [Gilvimarinus sp. SDUM040013]MDX6849110.1 azurin [Gilvimarinus sp. SDUM040013]